MPQSFQEYLTGNDQIAFPFKEDALALAPANTAAVHGAIATLPLNFLIDTVFVLPSQFFYPTLIENGELRLYSIEHTGTHYRFTIVSAIRSTIAVFDVPTGSLPVTYGVVAFQDTVTRLTMRLIVGEAFATHLGTMAPLSTDLFDDRLPFETAAVEYRPGRVEKIIIENDIPEEVTGGVSLIAGYNIQFTVDPADITPVEGTTDIRISARAGAGFGKRPCEPPDPIDYIATINGIGPDEDGNLTIDPTLCHRLGLLPAANKITIINDCAPCCSCQDYANAVEALEDFFDDLKVVKDQLDETIVDYNDQVTLYNTVIFPKYKALIVTGNGQVGYKPLDPDNAEHSPDSRNWATVVFRANNRGHDIEDVVLAISMPGFTAKHVVLTYQGVTTTIYQGTDAGVTVPGIPVGDMEKGSEAHVYMLVCRAHPAEGHGSAVITPSWTPAFAGDPGTSDPVAITW